MQTIGIYLQGALISIWQSMRPAPFVENNLCANQRASSVKAIKIGLSSASNVDLSPARVSNALLDIICSKKEDSASR